MGEGFRLMKEYNYVTIEDGRIKNEIPEEDSNDIDSVVSVKHEPSRENDNQLCTINYEHIKLEKELHTEVMINNGRIKSEIPEGDSNYIDSVVILSVKHEPVRENDNQLCTINYEHIKLEKELHTEVLINNGRIKSEIPEEDTQHKGIHSEEKPFSCSICNKTFSLKRYLVLHKQIHSEEKSFSCDICDKSFSQQSTLAAHKRIHSEEKSFSCRFNKRISLVQHKCIQSEEKPFTCNICNIKYEQQSDLITHQRFHSGETKFDIGNKSYIHRSNLKTYSRSIKSTNNIVTK
ncbi:zinc finger protein 271-like [Chrysoperla carnea]|uniref:zinc finger protein 271-like n=1 Tax=Chrysoperla carnea TaxID=189513 RepID=UPI001D06C52C|nr:zinc finger protein 271-like [Chrysoperla carnea]